jgi:hypothetical protein
VRIPPPRDQNNDLRVGNRLTRRPDQIHAGQILVFVRARDQIVGRQARALCLESMSDRKRPGFAGWW